MKKLLVAVFLLPVIYTQAQIGIGTTSPNSTLDVRGALSLNLRVFTGTTTTIGSTDNTVIFTGTLASTATLPDATTCSGRIYTIKNASTTSPTPVLTIATTLSQTIDGISSWILDEGYGSIAIVSNGTNWLISSQSVPKSSGSAWLQGGNSVSAIKKLGTISNYDLPFITNNTEKMRLTALGNLGIGTSSFNGTYPEKLLVDAGTTTSVNAIVGKGTINNYLQLNIQNLSTGTNASSDVVATASNGSETTNYVDMGINGGGNTSGVLGTADDAYLYNIGQNFFIGTGTAAKSLIFLTGGTDSASNEKMRIDGNGNVGIGTASPAAALHVVKSNSGGDVLTLQNTSASGYSSADFYSNTGVLSGTFGYGNGSTGAPFTGRNYFNSYGNDFLLANGSSTPFLVQGSTNNVGINNTSPSEKLDVTGNIRFSGALMPNNTAGTAGYFLQSNGAGTSPTWIDPSGTGWSLTGNSGISPITNFIGTTDSKSLRFRTNNTQRLIIDSIGNVAIGTSTFDATNPEKLLVDAGTTSSINVISGKGSINNYLQLNIQNKNTGNFASSDVVATADNGSETVNFIDMGINSSGYTVGGSAILNGINNAYLYATGNDFVLGNATASKNMLFFTGGIATSNERMRIDGSGNVGIGVTSPTAKLHLKAGTATASTAPLKFTSGTKLTTAEAGAMEFDGVNTYITNETTSGRGAIPVEQHFLLAAAGSTISTIANYFGATSNIPLVSGGYYEIEIDCYFLKTTAGTVTWTFTNSAAPTSMSLNYDFSDPSGIVSAPAATDVIGDQYNLTATAPTAVSASLTTAVNHHAHFKIMLLNGTGTSLKIQATCSAGTITPGIGSRWFSKRISTSNVGAFAN